jgi:hypothetical protein
MRRFAVGISALATEDQKAFLEFANSHGMGWWHYVSDFWLLIDWNDKVSPDQIRNFLMTSTSSKIGIVIEIIGEDNWSGFAPKDELEKTFAWLHKNWEKPQT